MIYVTVPGDTVSSISRQSGVPVWKIIYDNQLGEEGKLTVGAGAALIKTAGERGNSRGFVCDRVCISFY